MQDTSPGPQGFHCVYSVTHGLTVRALHWNRVRGPSGWGYCGAWGRGLCEAWGRAIGRAWWWGLFLPAGVNPQVTPQLFILPLQRLRRDIQGKCII